MEENQIKLTRRNSFETTFGIFFNNKKVKAINNITPILTSALGDPVPAYDIGSSLINSVDSKYPNPPGKKENIPSEISWV